MKTREEIHREIDQLTPDEMLDVLLFLHELQEPNCTTAPTKGGVSA